MTATTARRIATSLARLLPLAAATAWINFASDPAHLIRERSYADGIARLLTQGHAVVGATDFNERYMQRAVIRSLTKAPEVAVFGSSRSMQIGRTSLGEGRDLRNSSVSGGMLADHMALYASYRARGLTPGTVVLTVDPWIFNPSFEDEGNFLSVYDDYLETLSRLEGGTRPRLGLAWNARVLEIDKRLQVVSPTYLQASLARIAEGRPQTPPRPERPADDAAAAAILPDGSRRYSAEFSGHDPETVRRDAVAYGSAQTVYNLNGFPKLSPVLSARFERFANLIRRDGSRLILFLPPYHPAAYARIASRADTRAVLDAEAFVRKFAADNGVAVIGSYDPSVAGLSAEDFFDGMHPRPSGIRKMTRGKL